ncbi:MAG: hypothetical protein FWF44_11495, partial [Defluviitaleaceae bacterium]|nr:hypothetical protein [Defluviitaleaceae bacterium]
WWLLAFKPAGAVTGMKTGWLLIPASIDGLAGVIFALLGIVAQTPDARLLPGIAILIGGVVLYFILLAVTVLLFKRPSTSELILIIGWGMLALAEVNALFGFGLFPRARSVGFIIIICAAVAISLVCYVLYYRLDRRAGYIDGMIPLLLAALTMAGISCAMVIPNK